MACRAFGCSPARGGSTTATTLEPLALFNWSLSRNSARPASNFAFLTPFSSAFLFASLTASATISTPKTWMGNNPLTEHIQSKFNWCFAPLCTVQQGITRWFLCRSRRRTPWCLCPARPFLPPGDTEPQRPRSLFGRKPYEEENHWERKEISNVQQLT